MANSIEEKIRLWAYPILSGALGVICIAIVSEVRSDVKQLLHSRAETAVEISELKRRVTNTEEIILAQKLFAIKPDEIEIPKRKDD